MLVRNSVGRCVKLAASSATRAAIAQPVRAAKAAGQMQPTVARLHAQQVRLCSSSRFLSLADDDDGERKSRRRRGDDGEDGEDGDDEDGADAVDGEALEAGEKDGDLQLEEDEMYRFCVAETEELDQEMMELYMSNPLKWTPERLARKFHFSMQRVEATIHFQAEAAGLSADEFRTKVEEAKALAEQRAKEETANLTSAEARGDDKEVKRLQKRERQSQRDVSDIDDEELTSEEEATVHGIDEETYRNPDFFFLSDEFEGLPPLTRRMGKHKATDKLYPEEALEIQRLAGKNKIVELKSFAKPTDVQNRWKFAVKDISKNKLPLLVRTQDRALRLAERDEVLPRSWVRRPAFFAGLNPSDK